MPSPPAIEIDRLSHRYGERLALDELSLSIAAGEIFVFLGPNGGGKTTLFRLLSTLVAPQSGRLSVLGHELPGQTQRVREEIGVVFQAPSLDKKLTVAENMKHQAALYGIGGRLARKRSAELLALFGLSDRAGERTETLSGGLRRRVELAKSLIHQPRLLLLDEPSTGLDPAARSDMWRHFQSLREELGVTIALTTHLLEEADKADRIAILDRGKLVALDEPARLRAEVGGDAITIQTAEPAALAEAIAARFDFPATVLDGHVRLEQPEGHAWVARLVEAFPGRIEAITLSKPSLEDVFIEKTGHRFQASQETPA